MSDGEFAAIEARANAASAGPWQTFSTGVANGDHWYVWDNDTGSIAQISTNDGGNEDQRQPDAEFIAHAREDVPALLAAVRERDNTIAKVHELMQSWDNGDYDDMNQFSPHHFVRHLRAALEPQETL